MGYRVHRGHTKGEAAGAAASCSLWSAPLHSVVPQEQVISGQCSPNCFSSWCLCRCAHSPRLWGTGAVMEKCNLDYIMASFGGKIVWCWCMNEVEKPKVVFFRWKRAGRDLKLLRSCVFNWTSEWERKTIIRDCINQRMFFRALFYLQLGSESGSLHSDCKEKPHLSLSSSTESLTPQKVEGQRETLLSICTPSCVRDVPLAGRKPWSCACNTPLLAVLSSCLLTLNCQCLLQLRI